VGVVRLESSAVLDDPILAHPIASLLNLPKTSAPKADLEARFLDDLATLLAKLHRSSADFFRPSDSGKRLVPESVFAAHLALGFELLGWRSERQAQRGAGRADLVLRRNGCPEVMIVEVKIWGRNDYRQAHRQVASYWTREDPCPVASRNQQMPAKRRFSTAESSVLRWLLASDPSIRWQAMHDLSDAPAGEVAAALISPEGRSPTRKSARASTGRRHRRALTAGFLADPWSPGRRRSRYGYRGAASRSKHFPVLFRQRTHDIANDLGRAP
jgi:hypothetical protein